MWSIGPCGNRKQSGVAAVEFALVAMLFFVLLFGIIEMGRLLYVWNTVQEVTRRAAREAVVTDFSNAAAMAAVKQDALFGAASLPAAPEVGDLSVQIIYLNPSRNEIADSDLPTDPADNVEACADYADNCIAYVEASLQTCPKNGSCSAVQYLPMVGLFPFFQLNIPISTVVMPAESMGYNPTTP